MSFAITKQRINDARLLYNKGIEFCESSNAYIPITFFEASLIFLCIAKDCINQQYPNFLEATKTGRQRKKPSITTSSSALSTLNSLRNRLSHEIVIIAGKNVTAHVPSGKAYCGGNPDYKEPDGELGYVENTYTFIQQDGEVIDAKEQLGKCLFCFERFIRIIEAQ